MGTGRILAWYALLPRFSVSTVPKTGTLMIQPDKDIGNADWLKKRGKPAPLPQPPKPTKKKEG